MSRPANNASGSAVEAASPVPAPAARDRGEEILRRVGFQRPDYAIRELDGLRAIAILLVLARHGTKVFVTPQSGFFQLGPWNGASLAINGWAGVDLFFVLSGFLIAHHLLRRWSGRPWRHHQ